MLAHPIIFGAVALVVAVVVIVLAVIALSELEIGGK